jgi:O-antigen biosynthesis protein
VLYDQDRKKTLEQWIKKHGKYINYYINYAYLIFPFIAEQYMAKLKKYTTAKIIYNASDLFYLRERRNYEVTGDAELLKSSQKWKDRELRLFKIVDAIHVVSAFERKILAEALPGKKFGIFQFMCMRKRSILKSHLTTTGKTFCLWELLRSRRNG